VVVLGIDIGSAHIKAGMVNEQGAIVASRTIPTPADLDGFLPALQDAIRWLLEATALPAGVGVGCKGIIDPDSTRIEVLPGHLHFLQGLRLADLVGLPLDVPVFADNDARVALAGEMVWGAARGHSDVVMLTLGTGVGGAVLANGQLLRGPATGTEYGGSLSLSYIKYIASRGCNAVHLYAEDFVSGYAAGSMSNDVDQVVAMTRTNGIYLIITIANSWANGSNSLSFATNFWSFYAPRYANETHVLYEIHNEPVAWGPPYSATNATPPGGMILEEDCYKIIRAKAPSTPKGNIKRLTNGMVQLSYKAATHRKMTRMEKA